LVVTRREWDAFVWSDGFAVIPSLSDNTALIAVEPLIYSHQKIGSLSRTTARVYWMKVPMSQTRTMRFFPGTSC
jgi:hypothetical protein